MGNRRLTPQERAALLKRLAEVIPSYESCLEDFDRGVSEGKIKEDDVNRRFGEWWGSAGGTVGSVLRSWVSRKSRSLAHLTAALGCSSAKTDLLLASTEKVDASSVASIAIRLAEELKLEYPRLLRVLNEEVVSLGLRSTSGTSLRAARRPPDDNQPKR